VLVEQHRSHYEATVKAGRAAQERGAELDAQEQGIGRQRAALEGDLEGHRTAALAEQQVVWQQERDALCDYVQELLSRMQLLYDRVQRSEGQFTEADSQLVVALEKVAEMGSELESKARLEENLKMQIKVLKAEVSRAEGVLGPQQAGRGLMAQLQRENDSLKQKVEALVKHLDAFVSPNRCVCADACICVCVCARANVCVCVCMCVCV
jgi:chromosome segregation ATPase